MTISKFQQFPKEWRQKEKPCEKKNYEFINEHKSYAEYRNIL